MILPNGAVKIIDRAKNIFKLAQGEYIAPEKLENVYQKSSLIQQIFVYGDSLQSFLVAVVVPEQAQITKWASENSVAGDYDQLLSAPQTKKAILDDMNKLATEAKFNGLERIKQLHLHSDPFSVDNGLLTPTFKVKRFDAKKKFDSQITNMYAQK